MKKIKMLLMVLGCLSFMSPNKVDAADGCPWGFKSGQSCTCSNCKPCQSNKGTCVDPFDDPHCHCPQCETEYCKPGWRPAKEKKEKETRLRAHSGKLNVQREIDKSNVIARKQKL